MTETYWDIVNRMQDSRRSTSQAFRLRSLLDRILLNVNQNLKCEEECRQLEILLQDIRANDGARIDDAAKNKQKNGSHTSGQELGCAGV